MRQHIWTLAVLICIIVGFSNVESRTVVKRQAEKQNIDPNHQEVDPNDASRDKRKVDAAVGIKNALLGFVFNKPTISTGFSWEKPRLTTTPKGPTTTEDIVIFKKDEKVSLELPDQLFGSSFTLITDLSTTVGDYMINSALRAQRLLESMRPFLRAVFGAKGFVIEATTDKPIFSPAENSV